MLDVILISITMITLLVASYTDLKTREVPDWLNYSLIFGAFGIRLIFSVQGNWNILLSGILGFAVCFILAYFFYYTNQWGGGDSKLLMGMGTVIGITWPLDASSFTILAFLFGLLFLGAIYGVLWMVGIAFKKQQMFIKKFKELITKYKTMHIITGSVFIIFFAVTIKFAFLWPLVIFPLGMFYLFIFVNAVEKACFHSPVKPIDLTEGDWLAKEVRIKGRHIMSKKTLLKEDIDTLRKLATKGKLTTVIIKEGIPFIPSFLFAYLFILLGGPILTAIKSMVF